MSMRDLAQDAIDRAFATLGEACAYEHFAGGELQPAEPITAMPTSRDIVDRQWDVSRVRPEASFDIRRSEVTKPSKGSEITFAGGTYKVLGEPYNKDKLGLVWIVGCAKVPA